MFDNFFERFIDIISNNYMYILAGLKTTLLIAVLGLLLGLLIGSFIAIVKVTPKKNPIMKFINFFCSSYVNIVRGTPVTVQLLLMYFALLAPLRADKLLVAILVFGLNSGAYVSEIIRSGILSIDKGQTEAGRSLGLGYSSTMGNIILPQAIKNTVPTLGNEFIALLKETSVAGFIAVVDVTKAIQTIVASTYDALVPYIILAIVYLVLVYFITFLLKLLERRLRKSDSH